MNKWVIFGSIISVVGLALWLYGYLTIGTPPLIDWYLIVPLRIENFFRNLQCEAGLAFSIIGMLLISWPQL